MADLSKATPRPWRLKVSAGIGNAIEGNTGYIAYDGDDGYRTVALYQSPFDDDAQRKANGALIVTAVNSFDDLVAALRLIQVRASEACQSGTRDEISAALGWIDDEVRAALAKGGQ